MSASLRTSCGCEKWVAMAFVIARVLVATDAAPAELRRETLQSFDRYVGLTEARRDTERGDTFLWIDRVSGERRADLVRRVRRGGGTGGRRGTLRARKR